MFLRDLLAKNDWSTLIEPYDGYLHVIPRFAVALAYKIRPIEDFAESVSFVSCAIVAAICVGVYFLAASTFPNIWLRLMVASIPMLLPIAPVEVLGNAANLHWFLLWLAPWLLIREADFKLQRVGFFVLAFLTAASEVIAGLFMPLAIWLLWKRKDPGAPLGLIAGIAYQVITTLSHPRPASLRVEGSVDLWSVVVGFVVQPIAALWNTDGRVVGSMAINTGPIAFLVPTLLIIGFLVTILIAGSLVHKWLACGAVCAAIACWCASVLINSNPVFNYSHFSRTDWESFEFSRYAAGPGMFLLLLVPLAAASLSSKMDSPLETAPRWIAPACWATFTVVLLSNFFPSITLRDVGPEWRSGVRQAQASCALQRESGTGVVTVAPALWKFAQVQVPCVVLRKTAYETDLKF